MELPTVLLHLEAEPNATIQPMEPLEQQVLHLQDQIVATLDQHDQMMHQQGRTHLQHKVLPHHRAAAVAREVKVEAHHQAQVVVAVAAVEAADPLEGVVNNLN